MPVSLIPSNAEMLAVDLKSGVSLNFPPGSRCPSNRLVIHPSFSRRPSTSIIPLPDWLPFAFWPDAGNLALLPLRTRTRGPAYSLPALAPGTSDLDIDPDSESYDSLDEVLSLFRANTFFRNFEIKGPADRLLIYGILFLSEALGKIKPSMGKKEAEKVRSFTWPLGQGSADSSQGCEVVAMLRNVLCI